MPMFNHTLRDALQATCDEAMLQRWFDPLVFTVDRLRLEVGILFPHIFFEGLFPEAFRQTLESAVRSLFAAPMSIYYSTPAASSTALPVNKKKSAPTSSPWTFESFIISPKYKGLINILRTELIQTPFLYCPLILSGASGTGKTHLVRAAAHEWATVHHYNVCSMNIEELDARLTSESLHELQEYVCQHQLFILDNIHNLSLTEQLQNALIMLLDAFGDSQKPVLLAGTGRVSQWSFIPTLRSRLEQGLWFELSDPDLDIRFRFAQGQVKNLRLTISKDMLLLVAQRCTDMRRLSGVIRRFITHKQLIGRELTERDINNILQQSQTGIALTPQHIITRVAERCAVPPKEILGEIRRPDLVQARQLSMYLCRELLGHSYPVIGRLFGGKDHSTVMHGVKKIKLLQERDNVMHSLVTELTQEFLTQRE